MISHPVRPFAARYNPLTSTAAATLLAGAKSHRSPLPRHFCRGSLSHINFFPLFAAPTRLAAPLVKITGARSKVGRKPGKSSHVVGRVSTKQPVESPLPPAFLPSFPPFRHVGLTSGVCLFVHVSLCVLCVCVCVCSGRSSRAPAASRATHRLDVIYRVDGHPPPRAWPSSPVRHGPAALPPCRARGPLHVHGRKLMSPAIHV